jgi:membrane fusion protein, multidrug efflux system
MDRPDAGKFPSRPVSWVAANTLELSVYQMVTPARCLRQSVRYFRSLQTPEARNAMADSRTVITAASLLIALAAVGWGTYASKHAGNGAPAGGPPGGLPAGAMAGRGPVGGGRPPGGAAAPPVAVVTAVAQRETLDIAIEAIGTAVSNEAVNVTTKVTNLVTAIHFQDGQRVEAGQVLVELDRAQASAELAIATADYGNSVNQFNRSKELLASQSLSKAQYDQLEAAMKANEARVAAARARLADTYIRAPFAGRVGLRRISVGSLINPGTVVTTLDDTSSVKVDFAVPDVNLGVVRPGIPLVATTSAWPGRRFTGKVGSVDPRIDPTSRSVTVRALLPNGEGLLKPGMFMTVRLASEQRAAVVIPEEALVPEQARQFVYVSADGKAGKREVRIGRRQPGRVEVLEGLREGERVVVEGTLKLRDGAAVREVQPT